jgi:hypothetical protein
MVNRIGGEGQSAAVAYKRANGSKVVGALGDVSASDIVDGSPWRRFHWHPGQRNYCGTYWCATEHKHVDYESLLELSRLTMNDFDPAVRRIAGQPFHLTADIGGEHLGRTPDYLVLTDTDTVVVDVKNEADLEVPAVQHVLAMTRQVIESNGWCYEVASEPAAVRYANIRFLAGYRRDWLFQPDVVEHVRMCAYAMSGASIAEIVGAANLPSWRAFPALMHLLWRGTFTVDLDSRLSKATTMEAQS